MGGGGLLEKRKHPHEAGLCVSEGPLVHGHLKTDEKAVSSARDTRLEKFGVADPESEITKALAHLRKIDRSVADSLVLHPTGTIAHRFIFRSKDCIGVGALHVPDENFLCEKERACVKIPNGRK